jgi:hypothetical protein
VGDFSPSSPKSIPTEWRPRSMRTLLLNGPGNALAMRFRPGAVTLSHLHLYLAGGTPDAELAAEVVNTLTPTQGSDLIAPSTDVLTTGWTRSTGAGTWSSHLATWIDASVYLSTVDPTGQPFLTRSGSAALSAKRIRYIEVQIAGSTNAAAPKVQAVLRIGGVDFTGLQQSLPVGANPGVVTNRWYVNPSTGKPWTLAEANSFRTAGANSFGVQKATSGGAVVIYALQMLTGYSDENRFGWFTSNIVGSDLSQGWREYALTGAAALSAATWYWLLLWSPQPDVNGLSIPVLRFPETVAAASAAASVGEHRQVSNVTVDSSGYPITIAPTVGEILPVLFDSSGTIRSQSAPYAEVDVTPVSSGSPSPQLGQEITTSAASTAYGAVRIACGYHTVGVTPNAPLLVKIRTTSFTGTVQATATITPQDLFGGGMQDVQKDVDVVYTPPTSTKIFVTIESSATSGWDVCVLDQRTDLVTTTTAAEVQGQGFGGTTDAASPSGSTRDQRYDLSLSLISSPSAPGTIIVATRAGQ